MSTVIIGGGFYGLRLAIYLHQQLGVRDITILEKESSTMTHASYVNQARVHNGYHYPRSLLTGYRSRVNFPEFVAEYATAIKSDFTKYYAVARNLSKVNARQFETFARKIDADISNVTKDIQGLFNPKLIEKAFKVQEYAFDSFKLRDILLERINKLKGINLVTGLEVQRLEADDGHINVVTDSKTYSADKVINCTYSQINTLHRKSGLPLVALKHEIVEMCLVKLPIKLADFSVTVMDGPFFSIMPFPTTDYSSLSHVRYTPHMSWQDDRNTPVEMQNPYHYFESFNRQSNYRQMLADVQRYIPALKDLEYVKSIWEVKTILVKSEDDDSRPILFRSDFGLQGYTCIMGSKIDNIYDAFEGLASLYGKKI